MMGVAKAIVFGLFAMFPGSVLAVLAYWAMGGNLHSTNPADDFMYIPCYGTFFGSIAFGVWLGMRDEQEVELET